MSADPLDEFAADVTSLNEAAQALSSLKIWLKKRNPEYADYLLTFIDWRVDVLALMSACSADVAALDAAVTSMHKPERPDEQTHSGSKASSNDDREVPLFSISAVVVTKNRPPSSSPFEIPPELADPEQHPQSDSGQTQPDSSSDHDGQDAPPSGFGNIAVNTHPPLSSSPPGFHPDHMHSEEQPQSNPDPTQPDNPSGHDSQDAPLSAVGSAIANTPSPSSPPPSIPSELEEHLPSTPGRTQLDNSSKHEGQDAPSLDYDAAVADTSPSSFTLVPPELVIKIISCVAAAELYPGSEDSDTSPEPTTLLACALVNTTWSVFARRALWKRVKVSKVASMYSFVFSRVVSTRSNIMGAMWTVASLDVRACLHELDISYVDQSGLSDFVTATSVSLPEPLTFDIAESAAYH
ncbi:hypothetical protein HK102_009088 [Quaeritorhiza haematococci]|nr:hypothetical protein HK102_009088 [Quaeritorhiza haematococci]